MKQKIIKICCIKYYLIWGSYQKFVYETSSTEERQNIQNIHVFMRLHRASEMETFWSWIEDQETWLDRGKLESWMQERVFAPLSVV